MAHFTKSVILPFPRYESLKRAWEIQNGIKTSSEDIKPGEEIKKNKLSSEIILKYIPKRLRSKSERLLDYITQMDEITWNEDGHVTIRNQYFQNSNITDLIQYAVNSSFKSFIPEGASDFIHLLLTANVPLSLIAKQHRETPVGGSTLGIPAKIKYRDLNEWSW